MKIIDAFTFFNEVDLLKIRLELLYPQVDRFLICESNLTHSGHEKKYNYLIHEKEFEKWKDKITYIQFEQEIKNLEIKGFKMPYKRFQELILESESTGRLTRSKKK